MKIKKYLINFIFYCSVFLFVLSASLHVFSEKKKQSLAAGAKSIAGVVGAVVVCTPGSPPPCTANSSNCTINTTRSLQMTQTAGGDILIPPFLCEPITGFPGSSIMPGCTLLGGFSATAALSVPVTFVGCVAGAGG